MEKVNTLVEAESHFANSIDTVEAVNGEETKQITSIEDARQFYANTTGVESKSEEGQEQKTVASIEEATAHFAETIEPVIAEKEGKESQPVSSPTEAEQYFGT